MSITWTNADANGQMRFPFYRHGTRSNYRNGCRCGPCKKANSNRARYISRFPTHAAFRQRVYESTGGICYLCCELIEGRFHIDHIHPVALGGSDDLDNLLPTHIKCNLYKGDAPLLDLTQTP